MLPIVRTVVSFALVTAPLAACGPTRDRADSEEQRRGAETTRTLTLSLPQGLKMEDVALGASRSLVIAPQGQVTTKVQVLDKAGSGFATVANTGTLQSTIGPESTVGEVWTAAALVLAPKARVAGSVHTPRSVQRDPSATITGSIVTEPVSAATTTWTVVFPSASKGDVSLAPNASRTLAPDRYGSIRLSPRSKLALSSGTYYFEAIQLGPEARVEVDATNGPVQAFIARQLQSEGSFSVKDARAASLLIGYFGTEAATLRSPFAGTVVAPNAKITLLAGPSGTHVGAFFGRDIELAPAVTVRHAAYEQAGCLAKAEGARCSRGPRMCDGGVCRAGSCAPADDLPAACQVEPLLTCVIPGKEAGNYTAVFGYRSRTSRNVYAPPAAGSNFVSPEPLDRGQPGWFKGATAGEPSQPVAFAVSFAAGETVSWTLGDQPPAVASAALAASKSCTVRDDGVDGPVVVVDGKELTIAPEPARIIDRARGETEETSPGQAAGTTRGGLDINGGVSSYALPIAVPSGRRGLQPALSLHYSGSRGNDLAGVGWTLAGLSEIQACPTNLRLDPQNAPVVFDGTTAWCLDGERLIEVTGFNPGPDAYLKAGANDKELRTERTDGRRIIGRDYVDGVPSYFEVLARDGRVMSYGMHPDYVGKEHDGKRVLGRTMREAFLLADRRIVARSFPLTQVRDRFGNRMDVVFEVEAAKLNPTRPDSSFYDREHRPKEILYTGFKKELGLRSVRFEYSDRDPIDRVDQWFAGTNRRLTKLLTRIETYAPDPAAADGKPRPIRYYRLKHKKSAVSGRSLVESIAECEPGPNKKIDDGVQGGDDVCLAPVSFEWEPGDLGFETIAVDTGAEAVLPEGAEHDHGALSTADLNGDGQGDVLFAFKDGSGNRKHKLLLIYYSGE